MVNEYSIKSINDFKFIVVYSSPKITDQEIQINATSSVPFSQEQMIENNTKRFQTRILKHWNGNKSSEHTSMNSLAPAEHIDLNVFSIELK